MDMLSDIEPMVWLIIGAATIISVAVVFAKTIKVVLKLAVVAVMLAFVGYYLVQAGIIQLP